MSKFGKVVRRFKRLLKRPPAQIAPLEKTDAEKYADAFEVVIRDVDLKNSQFVERDYAYAVLRVFKTRGLPDVPMINEIAGILDQREIKVYNWPAKFFLYVTYLAEISIGRETPKLFADMCSKIFKTLPCCPITGTICAMPITEYSGEKLAVLAEIAEYFQPHQPSDCTHCERLASFIRSLRARLATQAQLKSLHTVDVNGTLDPSATTELVPAGLDLSSVKLHHDEPVSLIADALLTRIEYFVSTGEQHAQTVTLLNLPKVVLNPSSRGSTAEMIESVANQLITAEAAEARLVAATMLRTIS